MQNKKGRQKNELPFCNYKIVLFEIKFYSEHELAWADINLI